MLDLKQVSLEQALVQDQARQKRLVHNSTMSRGDDSSDLSEQLGRKNIKPKSSELITRHNVDQIPQGKEG